MIRHKAESSSSLIVYSARKSPNEVSGTTFLIVSARSCKAIMCRFLHMDNLGRGSHTPWALRARGNKAILLPWVSEITWTFLPGPTLVTFLRSRDDVKIVFAGIIPRAATQLFESLQGPSLNHAHQNSGLKTPTRYSATYMTGFLQNSSCQNYLKASNDKAWQMTATYVEVCCISLWWNC